MKSPELLLKLNADELGLFEFHMTPGVFSNGVTLAAKDVPMMVTWNCLFYASTLVRDVVCLDRGPSLCSSLHFVSASF